ncbi:substrate-binding domain-containing protein [Devosia sp. XGJD_8]|uniref:substrate-binding domain-containing protein n=1 Tax=Devosia sp. XGJD_8 TaxID=3391187 RepID=UPI0039849F5D
MKKTMLALAGLAIVGALSGSAYAQDKKILAVVVKGLDNPFFTVMGQGCADWNAANPDSEYECLYTGPALSSDEAGEVQIVQDLISRGVAGIAISPSNAPAMANMLRSAAPAMPIITVDADLLPADADLRKTYFGTNNYDMGVGMANELMKLKPEGGTVCLQLGNVAAANINERAAGFRDTIAGSKGIERLADTNGWTEIDGCPVFTNDDIPTANQQMADVFTANPDLTAFILVGGWAQFGPQAYAQNTDQVMDRLKSKDLIIIAGDTLPPQVQAFNEGRSHFQIGQRPYQMGNEAPDILIELIDGGTVEDPKFTGLDLCTLEDPGICAP